MNNVTNLKLINESWFIRDVRFLLGAILLAFFILKAIIPLYMVFATFSYLCLVVGLFLRKHRRTHASLMGLGIAIDLAIVLILEFNRHAINTAASFSLSPWQQLHIVTSSLATLLYIPVVYLGIMRLKGEGDARIKRMHLSLGVPAFIFRTMGFLFMFSFLWKKP